MFVPLFSLFFCLTRVSCLAPRHIKPNFETPSNQHNSQYSFHKLHFTMIPTNPVDTEAILSTVLAMRRQEEMTYWTGDCLYQSDPENVMANGPIHADAVVDIDCRSKMVTWCYQVIDFFKFDRETGAIAMNYLDRYMLTEQGAAAWVDRKLFQLAAMTCLYTAVKIHAPEAMDPKLVSTLSRGAYSTVEVEAMEVVVLNALQWRVNPPTALAFVRQFLELIPADVVDHSMRETAYDITKFQTELALTEHDFVAVKASTIAFGSLMNSLESLHLDEKDLGYIGYMLCQSIGIDQSDEDVLEVQNALYSTIDKQPRRTCTATSTAVIPSRKASRRSSFEISPGSVSAMMQ
jgi:hypothetical protein